MYIKENCDHAPMLIYNMDKSNPLFKQPVCRRCGKDIYKNTKKQIWETKSEQNFLTRLKKWIRINVQS